MSARQALIGACPPGHSGRSAKFPFRSRPPDPMPRLLDRCLALLLLACLSLAGCHRDPVAPGDPVAAVTGMAQAIRDNDLVRYSRLSVPPDLYKRLEKRWRDNLSAAPPPTAVEQRDYARWMLRLTGADAEKNLYRDFNAKLRKVESELGSQWPLMQATGGIFINGLIKANDKLGSAEKAHAQAVGTALLQWLTPATLTDRAKARAAIAILAQTARGLDLPTLEHTRRLEMIPALEKGGWQRRGGRRGRLDQGERCGRRLRRREGPSGQAGAGPEQRDQDGGRKKSVRLHRRRSRKGARHCRKTSPPATGPTALRNRRRPRGLSGAPVRAPSSGSTPAPGRRRRVAGRPRAVRR